MAQNITLMGASYSAVPSVLLPKTGGGTAQFDDTTIASSAATAADIASGKLAYVNGVLLTGTASGGTSKNTQVVQGTTRTSASKMGVVGAEMTVSKTGTYDIYWSGVRTSTSTSYTYATQLYINDTAYGSENSTWSNLVQNNHLTSVPLTANQKLRVRGRCSRGTSTYIYAPTLVIVEN